MKQLMLGNEAIARGAWEAGVSVSTAYPGTPSTEITEFISRYPQINAEWSVNEKGRFRGGYRRLDRRRQDAGVDEACRTQ